jgi:uncharacterized membrane protein YkgB
MPERRRARRRNDTQTVAFLLLAICLILATSVLIGGALALASLLAGAGCAFVHDLVKGRAP